MLMKHEFMCKGRLGKINVGEYAIKHTDEAKSFQSAPYCSGPTASKHEVFELTKQLHAGVIELDASKWGALVHFVFKKYERWRFCVDNCKLIETKMKESYPLPHMDDSIDSRGDSKSFSTLDANSS